jgi:CBS domain-containing protein
VSFVRANEIYNFHQLLDLVGHPRYTAEKKHLEPISAAEGKKPFSDSLLAVPIQSYWHVDCLNDEICPNQKEAPMRDLKASDIMVKHVVSGKKNASARSAALQLLTGSHSGMPVTDEEGKVIGVVTEFDLLKASLQGKELMKLKTEDVMSREVATADMSTPILDIIATMTEKNIIRLPITAGGKLVGVVSRSDILKNLIEPELVAYI